MISFSRIKFFLVIILITLLAAVIYTAKFKLISKNTEVFYVSPDGNDNFSGLYPEINSNKKDGPFKTIEKAKEVIRQKNLSGKSFNATVYLREGKYYINSTIIFMQKDCSRGNKVTFKNYREEKPILIGGERIKGWRKYKDSIYVANVEDLEVNSIYENGLRGVKARYPNDGYIKAGGISNAASKTTFRFSNELIPQINNQEQLQVCIWPGGQNGNISWNFNQIKVRDIDKVTRHIELTKEAIYEIGTGSRYYIQDALELLDREGEYYLDKAHGDLYYWPYSLPIEEQEIILPKLTTIIKFEGSSTEELRNITIEGLSIAGTNIEEQYDNEGLVTISHYSSNITIKNCKIYNAGSIGILISGITSKNNIYGNLIYDTGYDGIRISVGNSIKYVNRNNSIINNYIHDTGKIIRHAKGIAIDNSGDNTVSNNTIRNVPRDGISLISPRPGTIIGAYIDGILVTRENAKNFAHCRNNIVQYNDISRAVQDSQDAGLIGCWGVGPGNIINNNYLHNSDVVFSFGVGIYLDDGSDYVTIRNNILANLQKKNLEGYLLTAIYAKGIGNRIENNVCVNNDERAAAISTFQMNGEPNNNIIVERNIFYNTGKYIYNFANWEDNRLKCSDYNLFYNTLGSYLIKGAPISSQLSSWIKSGYDKHSLIEDPLFMDWENGDYRLRYDSKIYKLGYKDVNLDKPGLLSDFKYTDKTDTIDRIFVKTDNGGDKAWTDLQLGKSDKFILSARTKSGYFMDLKEAKVEFTTDSNRIATVDEKGCIYARSKGISKVTIFITISNKKYEKYFYVVVK